VVVLVVVRFLAAAEVEAVGQEMRLMAVQEGLVPIMGQLVLVARVARVVRSEAAQVEVDIVGFFQADPVLLGRNPEGVEAVLLQLAVLMQVAQARQARLS
jgi:hypothetical protein